MFYISLNNLNNFILTLNALSILHILLIFFFFNKKQTLFFNRIIICAELHKCYGKLNDPLKFDVPILLLIA